MKIETLDDLFQAQLKDIYYAEQKLVKELPKMAEEATDQELSDGFSDHAEETKGHVERLEQVFELIGVKAEGEKCEAIEGLVKEAKEIIDETDDEETINAALIIAAQKVEHYEIATYGTLCAFAKRLGYNEAATILHKTLEEEKACDQKLSKLAMGGINEAAAAA